MASPAEPIRIADKAGADALVARLLDTMKALEGLLAQESEHVRGGRLRQGLAESERKGALSAAYLQSLEFAKANIVALTRFAPQGLEALRTAHRAFTIAVEANQTVLATARTVSEGLIKTLANDIATSRAPSVYGTPSYAPSPYGRGARSGPLLVSRSL